MKLTTKLTVHTESKGNQLNALAGDEEHIRKSLRAMIAAERIRLGIDNKVGHDIEYTFEHNGKEYTERSAFMPRTAKGQEIASHVYREAEKLGADMNLLTIIGSLGDTLGEAGTLNLIK